MQEKLEEKDQEIQRLKQELQQRRSMEEEKTDSPSDRKTSNEITTGEADNWKNEIAKIL